MKTPISLEVATHLFECVEIVTALANRRDDFESFTYFNLTDCLLEMYPEITGTPYSEAFDKLIKR